MRFIDIENYLSTVNDIRIIQRRVKENYSYCRSYFELLNQMNNFTSANYTDIIANVANQNTYTKYFIDKLIELQNYRETIIKKENILYLKQNKRVVSSIKILEFGMSELISSLRERNEDSIRKCLKKFQNSLPISKNDFYVHLNPEIQKELKVLDLISKKVISGEKFIFQEMGIGLNKLKYGDIILHFNLSKNSEKLSFSAVIKRTLRWSIQKVTKSLISHVSLYIGGGKVFEALQFKGIHISDLHKVNDHFLLVLRGNLNEEKQKKLSDEVEKIISNNDGYGYKEILGQMIFQKTGKYPKILRNDKTFYCSKLIDYLYNQIGIHTVSGTTSQAINPGDFIESRYLKLISIIDNDGGTIAESVFDCLDHIKKTRLTLSNFYA